MYTMRKSFINVEAPIQLKSAFYVSDAGWLTQDRRIRGDFLCPGKEGRQTCYIYSWKCYDCLFLCRHWGPGKLSCQQLREEAKFAALGWAAEKGGLAKSMAAAQLCHKMPQGTHYGLRMRLTQALLINSVPTQVLFLSLNVLPHTHRHTYTAMDSGCPVNLALGMFLASSWTRTSQTTIPQPPPLLAAWCVEEMHAHSQEQLIKFSKHNESQVWNLIMSQKTPVDPFKSSYNLLAFTEWPYVM